MEERPDFLKGNTSLIWMHERNQGNKDWPLEGLVYVATDETGRHADLQLKSAFELHLQNTQMIVLHHPKYQPKDLKKKLKEKVLERYSELNLEF
tara:strand:- start:726 stop:1007 length:282 start_codon:yes stop_codon:yes gene_type:complete